MDGLFDSAWLKWYWADVHTQQLQREVNAWINEVHGKPAIRAGGRYEPKRHCYVIYAEEILTPYPVTWGLRIGDIAHAYRSCLDHLAWALVQRGSRASNLTERQQKQVYFPLATSPTHFRNAARTMLPGVRRADLTLVRRYQPYASAGMRGVPSHIFTQLDRLSNADKHRTIQPAIAIPEEATYELNGAYDCTVTRFGEKALRMPIEVGAELAWFYVRKRGPNPRLDVKGHLHTYPALSGSVFGAEDWLKRMAPFTRNLLSAFADPPEITVP